MGEAGRTSLGDAGILHQQSPDAKPLPPRGPLCLQELVVPGKGRMCVSGDISDHVSEIWKVHCVWPGLSDLLSSILPEMLSVQFDSSGVKSVIGRVILRKSQPLPSLYPCPVAPVSHPLVSAGTNGTTLALHSAGGWVCHLTLPVHPQKSSAEGPWGHADGKGNGSCDGLQRLKGRVGKMMQDALRHF